MSKTVIKILGLIATVGSIGCQLVSNFVGEKQLDAKIAEKVNEALANRN